VISKFCFATVLVRLRHLRAASQAAGGDQFVARDAAHGDKCVARDGAAALPAEVPTASDAEA
jgi:hypothetical protein